MTGVEPVQAAQLVVAQGRRQPGRLRHRQGIGRQPRAQLLQPAVGADFHLVAVDLGAAGERDAERLDRGQRLERAIPGAVGGGAVQQHPPVPQPDDRTLGFGERVELRDAQLAVAERELPVELQHPVAAEERPRVGRRVARPDHRAGGQPGQLRGPVHRQFRGVERAGEQFGDLAVSQRDRRRNRRRQQRSQCGPHFGPVPQRQQDLVPRLLASGAPQLFRVDQRFAPAVHLDDRAEPAARQVVGFDPQRHPQRRPHPGDVAEEPQQQRVRLRQPRRISRDRRRVGVRRHRVGEAAQPRFFVGVERSGPSGRGAPFRGFGGQRPEPSRRICQRPQDRHRLRSRQPQRGHGAHPVRQHDLDRAGSPGTVRLRAVRSPEHDPARLHHC